MNDLQSPTRLHTEANGIQSDAFLTLSQAAKIAPGRPSTNCMWRWCRRGVLSRSGHRVRLRHMRIGGKIFVAPAWIDDFGRALAEADAAYFDAKDEAAASVPHRSREYDAPTRPKRRRQTAASTACREFSEIDRELDAEGL